MESQLRIERVPLDDIRPDPANVRLHGERNLASIQGSLVRFGQQKPIVVDPQGVIRAGNGTYHAARALGWKEIEVVRSGLEGVFYCRHRRDLAKPRRLTGPKLHWSRS